MAFQQLGRLRLVHQGAGLRCLGLSDILNVFTFTCIYKSIVTIKHYAGHIVARKCNV